MTLTKQKLTTSMGYLKYSSRSMALRAARKLGLSGTHKHVMQGQRIYMPATATRMTTWRFTDAREPPIFVSAHHVSGGSPPQ